MVSWFDIPIVVDEVVVVIVVVAEMVDFGSVNEPGNNINAALVIQANMRVKSLIALETSFALVF